MAYRIQVHISNEDPIVMDVEELPDPNHTYLMGSNPQRRDGKDVQYILHEVNEIILPMHRVTMIQILPAAGAEDIETFVRE